MDGRPHNPDLSSEATAARLLVEAMADSGFDTDDISCGIESETNFLEAVSATVRRMDELEHIAGAAKALAAQYVERAKALEGRREVLRDKLVEALERSGVPLPLRLAEGTVTLTSPAPSAVVIDEQALPDEYVRTKVTKSPDLRSIALDLRDGKAVPGAALRNARRALSVRRA
jgi:hypothetical protein